MYKIMIIEADRGKQSLYKFYTYLEDNEEKIWQTEPESEDSEEVQVAKKIRELLTNGYTEKSLMVVETQKFQVNVTFSSTTQ